MRATPSLTRPHQHPALCLLLALLLALSPLMSAAQAPAAADNTAGAAVSSTQMPCHSDSISGSSDIPTMHADCPHCAGDAPANQCQCCDQAAPAGLLTPTIDGQATSTGDADRAAMLSDALPRSPGERLYRPPIQSS